VTFVLINEFGGRCEIGDSIITGQTDRSEGFDEDGDTFPDVDAAEERCRVSGETDRRVTTPGKT
jgi:hypothetical protein